MALIGVPPQPGHIVRVRQRRYLVEEVTPPPSPGDSTLVRLSCLDDDAQGQPLAILWENELDPEVLSGEDWNRIAERGFDAPHLFASYGPSQKICPISFGSRIGMASEYACFQGIQRLLYIYCI